MVTHKHAHQRVSVPELAIEHTFHPFGRGVLTSDGVQYSALGTSTKNAYADVEVISVTLPVDVSVLEWNLGVTWRQKSAGTVDAAVGKVQGRNNGGTWTDLMATPSTNTTVGTAFQEFTYSGYFAATGDFNAVPFDLKVVVKSSGTTDNAIAQVKNSSYVSVICDPR